MALEALLHFPSFQGLSNKLAASLRCEQSILVPLLAGTVTGPPAHVPVSTVGLLLLFPHCVYTLAGAQVTSFRSEQCEPS